MVIVEKDCPGQDAGLVQSKRIIYGTGGTEFFQFERLVKISKWIIELSKLAIGVFNLVLHS